MPKQNCWESKNCGREPGGAKVDILGVCPAAVNPKVDGIHGGINGGRCCWAVSGTLCGGQIQGIYAVKLQNCIQCDFYQAVTAEEGKSKLNSMQILARLDKEAVSTGPNGGKTK